MLHSVAIPGKLNYLGGDFMSTYMSYYVTWDANHFSLNSYKYRLCLLRGSGGQRKSFQRMRWFHGCIFELTVAYGIGIDSFLAAGIYFFVWKVLTNHTFFPKINMPQSRRPHWPTQKGPTVQDDRTLHVEPSRSAGSGKICRRHPHSERSKHWSLLWNLVKGCILLAMT